MAEYDERRRLLLADIKKYEQDRKEFTQYVAQVAKEVRCLHFAFKCNQGPPEDVHVSLSDFSRTWSDTVF